MRVIQISEERLDELFATTLDKLALRKCLNRKCQCERIVGRQPLDEALDAFHYAVCVLKDTIKKA